MPHASACKKTPAGAACAFLARLLIAAALAAPAAAAERRYYFDTHDSASELEQHSVTAIVQDQAGYVWIGTRGGLELYDGYRYQRHAHDPGDASSLPDSHVTALLDDGHNRLWVGGNEAGIASIDRASGKATAYRLPADALRRQRRNSIGALAFDRRHTLWIGSAAGIERFDVESGQRTESFVFAAAGGMPQVAQIALGADGSVWAATSAGLLHLAADGSHVESVDASAIVDATSLAFTAGGAIYVGTSQGLFRVDAARARSERVWPATSTERTPRKVTRIVQDGIGRLWLALENAGLAVYDPAGGAAEILAHDINMPGSLPEDSVTALLLDRSGLLWVGTSAHGFATVDPHGARFAYLVDLGDEATASHGNDVRALFEDRQKVLWFGTRGAGLRRYDRAGGRFDAFNLPLQRAGAGTGPLLVGDIRGGDDDTLWIATDHGAFELDAARRNARALPVDPAQGLPSPRVNVLLPAHDGSMWFGTADAGLAHWFPGNGRWEYFRAGASGNTALAHDSVLALAEDHDDRVWIGTLGGLSVYDPRSAVMRSVRAGGGDTRTLSDETVLALHAGSDGALWIGTRSGLHRYLPDGAGTGLLTRYPARDGLGADAVFGILEDRKGALWLGTNRGIVSFDREHDLFHAFALKDGLQGLEFNIGAAATLADGRLAFGGSDGVNVFDPAQVRFSRFAAPAVITALRVDDKPLGLPAADQQLEIDPAARVVRLEFAALDYAAPDHNEFSYRLRGFDDAWVRAGRRHDVTYTNLPPGAYRFELRGSNRDGMWNERLAALDFVITPPWWAQRRMLALYTLVALLVIVRVRHEFVRKREAERRHHRAIVERENRLRLALWGSGDEFWDWDLVRDEIVMTGVGDLLRSTAEQRPVPARVWTHDNVHEDHRGVVAERIEDHLHGLREQFESEHRVRGRNGEWLWVFARGKIVERDDHGKPLRMSGTVRDVTASRAAERERRISAEVIDSMTEAVCVTDLEFRFVSANRAFTRMTGYEQAAIVGQSAAILNCAKHPPEYYRAMREAFMREGHWRGELWQRRRDGEEFLCWLEISVVHDAVGERTHYVGVMSDITDRKRAEQELRYLANYDTMTGLPNRALLSERLGQAIMRGRHNGHRVAVLFLDLDRFKHVNDSMGHAAGDRMLRAAGARLRACIAPTDTVARLGGDEFTVVLENLTAAHQAEGVAQKLLEAFTVPLHLDSGEDVVISPSIGISLFPDHGQVPSELLKFADTAMYQAKDRGRNTYMLYTAEMDAAARSRATLIAALRRGLERNEFNVVYQPKLSLIENRVIGVEALLRWNNEEFGSVAPATFIPLAEDTGLIVPIGEYVLNAACAQLRRWQDQGFADLKVAVNLSMLQLLRGELTVRLHQILQTHGLAAGSLELELTETMVMDNAEQSVRTLTELKAIGVSLAIDDFGTGYSSLSYLKRLPIDTLKIDQAFVGDITTDPDDAAITATIINMAHSLDLNVVAEGVETAEQLQYLRSQGCDEIQGHWFARPLEADACFTFMAMYENNRMGKIEA